MKRFYYTQVDIYLNRNFNLDFLNLDFFLTFKNPKYQAKSPKADYIYVNLHEDSNCSRVKFVESIQGTGLVRKVKHL